MSVDNFRVYDIRMLPAQEIKTIYDAFIFHTPILWYAYQLGDTQWITT